METLQARTDSFKSKRVKNPAKTSSYITVKWPHSQQFTATPAVLAEAGFYYNPSYADRDNVTCFFCQKQLSDWEADDDPFDIHWIKCGSTCCWAIVRCGLRGDMDDQLRFISTDKSRLPTSKLMERARLETFTVGAGWVHDQDISHGANSRKMASAGFVYTPQSRGDDLATCLYCDVSLSGWDADDDPLEEHKKREDKSAHPCAFIAALGSTATKPSSRSQSKPLLKPIQPKSKHKDTVALTKIHDGEIDDDSDVGGPAGPSTKRPTKGRSTSGSTRSTSSLTRSAKIAAASQAPRKHTRSQSRDELHDVAEGDENPEDGEEEEVAPRVRRKTASTIKTKKPLSKSKIVPRAKDTVGEEDSDEIVVRKTSRSRSKAKEEDIIEGEGEQEVKTLKRSVRGRPKKVIPNSEEEDGGTNNLKKSTRGKPKLKAALAEAMDTEQEQLIPMKQSRTKSKAKPTPEQELNEEEASKLPSRTNPPSTAALSRKPSRSKPKSPLIEDEVEKEKENVSDTTSTLEAERQDVLSTPSNSNTKTSTVKSRFREPESSSDTREDADENDAPVPPQILPPPHPASSPIQQEVVQPSTEAEEFALLIIPKRNVKAEGNNSPPVIKRESNMIPNHTVGMEGAPEPIRQLKKQLFKSQKPFPKAQPLPRNIETSSATKGTTKSKGIKVVEILTDEEDDEQWSQPPQVVESTKPVKVAGEDGAELAGTAPQPGEDSEPAVISKPKVTSASYGTLLGEDEDIEMNAVEVTLDVEHPPSLEQSGKNHRDNTPPRTPTKYIVQLAPEPVGSSFGEPAPTQIFPPLSKLPFMPLQHLTDPELDMTVEEWIRYQMEVEYDKFRRDGERELGRFQKRAEEVRHMIEAL